MQTYDLIVIGTGAGGGTLARKLAPSGKKILILERGGYLPREKENWSSKSVFTEARYKAHEAWLDKEGNEFHPGIHYYVGGNTKVFGAALLRMRREDFGVVEHKGGISPAWPIRYEELEPYYTQAEHLYHVHGERGADPTEPPASAPYRHAPLAHEPRIAELRDDFRRLGLQPFPLPVGIRRNEQNPAETSCIRCATCDGFPCLVEAKADAHVIGINAALQHPNVTLLTNAKATRLLTDASGHSVVAVEAEVNGELVQFRSNLVVVAAGAVQSAALLLRSANEKHPRGLANGSDVVGRHYMAHHNSAVLAISKRENPTVFQKTLGLNDFYFGEPGFPYPMGHIQMLGKSDVEMLREGAPRFAPGFALELLAKHSLDFWLTSEDLPHAENRVTLEPDGRIRLSYTEANVEGHQRLVKRLKALLSEIGHDSTWLPLPANLYLGKKIPVAGTAHQCGTVRFGRDPRSSALNELCQSHEVENLYVVDGSFFPSSSAVNPALTIMANALRVGDHLLARLG
ncbi:MAG: GMC family oxidoreductase [Planctomycetes bacterium]|nr:GMC family oxidoreductase [Planctomycetota bacterium]